jgi:hypothetical protein
MKVENQEKNGSQLWVEPTSVSASLELGESEVGESMGTSCKRIESWVGANWVRVEKNWELGLANRM